MAELRPMYDLQGDVDRLVDLLCMLPVPRMDEPVSASYWTGIAATEKQPKGPKGRRSDEEVAEDEAAYLTNRLGRSMLSVMRYREEQEANGLPVCDRLEAAQELAEFALAEAAKELAEFVLVFFAGERPDLWRAMWANIRPSNQTSPEAVGRLWCEDACATAWRIYSACESAEHRDKVLDTLYDLKP